MRPTTTPEHWKELLDAAGERAYAEGKGGGSINYLCEALEIAPSTLRRASRGEIKLGEDIASRLQVLCDMWDLDNPYEKTRPWSKDLIPLRMLGQEIEMGLPVSPKAVARLRKMYPETQLVALANSDGTPTSIMRGVARLLEDS